ncbi:heme peroxidase [Actinocatenispora thailandica]|uniref:Heme peroxidase n=1 Tax=Actinocatenispora thailandica TaxID=227318 RepID=A0A7R7DQN0_9ACTN|nr:peroxidase family protein [Actinocatenispora thailandica]BCJ35732.1 heme peroxidase [Actinocatenispora thailandica]
MSSPTGDEDARRDIRRRRLPHDGFLHELEHGVEAELDLAEDGPDGRPDPRPVDEWLDPDAQRYEIGLRNLLGAVEAAEDSVHEVMPGAGHASRPTASTSDTLGAARRMAAVPYRHGSRVPAHDHCLNPARAAGRPSAAARYGRMFPQLEPLAGDPTSVLRAGDAHDAGAALDRPDGAGDDAAEAAGWPFFGQLVGHDITAGRSPADGATEPGQPHDARAPKLDLQLLYADGPIGSPFLFDLDDPAKFLLGPDGRDVPRNRQGVALIGDPRNDVHLFALSLHVALLRAHNRIVDRLRTAGVAEADLVDAARVTLTWHYQWIVVHDFLPRLVGTELVERVLVEGGRWFAPEPGHGYVPLEFADAAYRYGHGQIRHSYRLVAGGTAVPLFPDLVGFGPLRADRRLDFAQLFDLPGRPAAQRAKRLDGRLATSLVGLPETVTGDVEAGHRRSLAARDLLRGASTGLPSGEAVARLLGAAPLTADELGHDHPHGTPLWYYVLREAQHRGGGDRLGPVGGTIVAEVLIGLLRADPASYLSLEPGWQPNLPAAGATYALTDLLALGDDREGT